MDEIVREFLIESAEGLDQVDRDLLALEDAPQDQAALASVFRAMHTIKGTAGFLDVPGILKLAHRAESLLDVLRSGKLILSSAIMDALLETVDRLRAALARLETTGHEGEVADEALLERLVALAAGTAVTAPPAASAVAEPAPATALPPPPAIALPPPPATSALAALDTDDAGSALAALVAAAPGLAAPPVAKAPATVTPAPAHPTAPAAAEARSAADSVVRLDVGLLDAMVDLVGELVLTRNRLNQVAAHVDHPEAAAVAQRLDQVTSELQRQVMRTRMQPISTVWSKLPRVVRDLAASCGKQIQLDLEGQDTELDRSLVEAIKDPLTHMVRNSIDHGIEAPAARVAAGKPAAGTLGLRAFHQGGQVILEIRDDGKGLDVDAIRRKGLERGLLTAERAAAATDAELMRLIFLPGFSTAAAVSNLSGRGVGMDVVLTNLEKIGGTIDVDSALGRGTTFRLRIPLTLAILPALLARCGRQTYVVAQTALVELLHLEHERIATAIESIQGAPVYRLRDELLPLVRLSDLLGQPPRAQGDGAIDIVVLASDDGSRFGLMVDEILDTEEIVVKPLPSALDAAGLYAGTTILGNGRVALILDATGLAERAGLTGARRAALDASAAPTIRRTARLLVVETRGGELAAIPLAQIGRIEEIAPTAIERVRGQAVVQYHGRLLPLIDLHTPGGAGNLHVLVHHGADRAVGVVVDRVHDVVDAAVDDLSAQAAGGALHDTSVVLGRATAIVDLARVVAAHARGAA
jgi:two-component system, chemotaxis family, sensor kinase CheA